MSSTGNDIVAFAATDPLRTSQYRFYSRILSAEECALHDHAALDFSSFVWLLWSIKESVYKYVSRSNHALIFAPLKIPVGRLIGGDGIFEGMVSCSGRTLYSRSIVNDEAIMTVVSAEQDFSDTYWGMRALEAADGASESASQSESQSESQSKSQSESQSERVRDFAIQHLSAAYPGADLRIVRLPDGPPELMDGERVLNVPVSLAHHERYVAWSFRLPSSLRLSSSASLSSSPCLSSNNSLHRKSAAH